ncbi:MAG: hypothetical protein J5I94_22385 [Phaeodactylibacter sp.]|nr:hypothetical protein [Phaeodactylibacter sp.]
MDKTLIDKIRIQLENDNLPGALDMAMGLSHNLKGPIGESFYKLFEQMFSLLSLLAKEHYYPKLNKEAISIQMNRIVTSMLDLLKMIVGKNPAKEEIRNEIKRANNRSALTKLLKLTKETGPGLYKEAIIISNRFEELMKQVEESYSQ